MTELLWRTSSFTSGGNNCVELADAGDAVLLRDSKHPEAGHVSLSRSELGAFVAGCKAGEFDDLV